MRKLIQPLIALIVALAACTATPAISTAKLAPTVVFLENVSPPQLGQSGSGVFVHDRLNRLFIVTAAHVAKEMRNIATATTWSPNDRPVTFFLRDLVGVGSDDLHWRFHPKADLAALELKPDPMLTMELEGRFLSIERFCKDQIAPPREIALTVLGFPLALGATGRFSPISRETNAASGLLTTRGAGEQPTVFVLQDPSIGGYSGAPVFDTGKGYYDSQGGMIIRTSSLTVFGIVTATMFDKTGGKLGVVVPSFQVTESISSADKER